MYIVIDTNVPIVANGKTKQASPECVTACSDILEEIYIEQKHILILDKDWEIIEEYEKNLDSKRNGVGNTFLKWLYINRTKTNHCQSVVITPHPDRDFEEFPDDVRLEQFDHSDRKFFAVARAHPEHPPIYNATDSDWWHYRDVLKEHGVHVEFLCPDAMKERCSG